MKAIKCTYRETPSSYRIECEKDVPLLESPPGAIFQLTFDMLLDPVTKNVVHINTQITVPEQLLEKTYEVLKELYSETNTKPYVHVYDLYLRDYELLAILRKIFRTIYPDINIAETVEELQYKNLCNEVEIKYVVRKLST